MLSQASSHPSSERGSNHSPHDSPTEPGHYSAPPSAEDGTAEDQRGGAADTAAAPSSDDERTVAAVVQPPELPATVASRASAYGGSASDTDRAGAAAITHTPSSSSAARLSPRQQDSGSRIASPPLAGSASEQRSPRGSKADSAPRGDVEGREDQTTASVPVGAGAGGLSLLQQQHFFDGAPSDPVKQPHNDDASYPEALPGPTISPNYATLPSLSQYGEQQPQSPSCAPSPYSTGAYYSASAALPSIPAIPAGHPPYAHTPAGAAGPPPTPAADAPTSAEWSTGLFDLQDDVPACADACLCPWCLSAALFNRLYRRQQGIYWPLCAGMCCVDLCWSCTCYVVVTNCLFSLVVRRELRKRYGVWSYGPFGKFIHNGRHAEVTIVDADGAPTETTPGAASAAAAAAAGHGSERANNRMNVLTVSLFDAVVACFCTPCVAAQHYREMVARGDGPGAVVFIRERPAASSAPGVTIAR